jgi:hypothetical protein
MFSADLGVTPSSAANYIEDVFSTWLYTGNSTTGGTQTITNSVDLSTKGGMVWIKGRSAASNHVLFDTTRGAGTTASNNQAISSNSGTGEDLGASYDFLSAFNTDGFTVTQGGTTAATRGTNYNNVTYASWTFRKQPKFFDVVTYTGTGANRTIAHNLGAVPGCIMIKRTDASAAWAVYHRSLANTQYMVLNSTAAAVTGATYWNSTTPTSSVFSLGTSTDVNASGGTYVAYLFAHDAGGFGATGSDNVISCGSFTGSNINNVAVTLGYEPQWILWRTATAADSWKIADNMRGMPIGSGLSSSTVNLFPNLSFAESTQSGVAPTATGFIWYANGAVSVSDTYIYIAIRRGPMRTPTVGTSVLSVKLYAAGTTSATVTHDVTFDAEINANRTVSIEKFLFVDSLRGINGRAVVSANSNGEGSFPTYWSRQSQRTMYAPSAFDSWWASSSGTENHVSYGLVRAPGFFDIVCYTGTGANRTVTHNLGAVPELMIVKGRSGTTAWQVYSSALANTEYLVLNTTAAKATGATRWNSTTPTSSVFSLGTATEVNTSAATYVAYLFASVAGVSKVGFYTGLGAGFTLTLNCGFTSGARFVLIKRTDSTGDWYVWDSARGISSGNDPYLLLNSTATEVTGTNYVDTASIGFQVTSAASTTVNVSGGFYIFWAIA